MKKILISIRKKMLYMYFLQAIKCSGVVIEISAINAFILVPFYAEFTCTRAWRSALYPMHVTSGAIRCTWSRAPTARYRRATINKKLPEIRGSRQSIYQVYTNRHLLSLFLNHTYNCTMSNILENRFN